MELETKMEIKTLTLELVELETLELRNRNWIIKNWFIYYYLTLLFKIIIYSFRTLYKGQESEPTKFEINKGRPPKLVNLLNTFLI